VFLQEGMISSPKNHSKYSISQVDGNLDQPNLWASGSGLMQHWVARFD